MNIERIDTATDLEPIIDLCAALIFAAVALAQSHVVLHALCQISRDYSYNASRAANCRIIPFAHVT